MDKKLRKVQIIETEILSKIDEICIKNNIEYFLIGGTLLGAIRHEGFIPWDDDIDIGMLRGDYDKFIELCKKEKVLGDNYYLQSYETDENYYLPFAKVRKNKTTFAEKLIKNLNTHKGIFVDIFPYDNVPKQKSFVQKLQAIIVRNINDAIDVKYGIYTLKSRRRPVLVALFKIFSLKTLKKMETKISKLYNNKNTDYITCLSGTYDYITETLKREIIFPLKKVKFEKKEFNGLNDNDYFLTRQFGDYMKLPKEEDRKNHMPEHISFTEGDVKINEN